MKEDNNKKTLEIRDINVPLNVVEQYNQQHEEIVKQEEPKETKEVTSIIDEEPNLASQKTMLVTDPVTLKTETKVVEEQPVENVVVEKKSLEDGPKWKRTLVLVFFIFVFAFVMGMPYINEYLDSLKKEVGMSDIERRAKEIEDEQKKAEEEKNKPVVQEKLKTLTCKSTSQATTEYTKVIEETFNYNSKNQVIKSSIKTTYTFEAINDSYNSLKTQCDEKGLKFIDKDGFESACSYSDTEVVIENTFDLEIFKPIQDGTTTISANAEYQAKLDTVKNNLVAQGYTCE